MIVNIPLVFLRKDKKFHGFVPGFMFEDVIEDSIEVCAEKLVSYAKKYVELLNNQKQDLPRFPDEKEIGQDFQNVVAVRFLKYNKK